jgi:hypothetical protein
MSTSEFRERGKHGEVGEVSEVIERGASGEEILVNYGPF